MNIKQTLVIALPALLCGALLGYHLRPAVIPQTSDRPEKATARKAKHATGDADLARLRARVQELERQLAAATSAAVEKDEQIAQQPQDNKDTRRRFAPPTPEEMEQIRINDPARYTQMTNRFANFQRMLASRAEQNANRLDILASVDTSHMGEKQKANHLKFQEMLTQREELRARMLPGNELTPEQRHQLHQQEWQLNQELWKLSQQERNMLLNQTSRAFGITGENQKELVETVKAVIDATTVDGWGRHGGRGHGPRGAR